MARLISAAAPDALELAARVLRRGGIVALPTETVYGLAVLPQQGPLERLLRAKQRASDKGIQLLVDSIEQVASLATLSAAAEQLARGLWPGGLTLILDRRSDVDLPVLLGGGRSTLGLRLPDHAVPRALARALGPLAASSANISGQPDATTAELVERSLGDSIDLILDDGPVRGGIPSTVVDCSLSGGGPRIVRQGAIPMATISELLGQDYTGR